MINEWRFGATASPFAMWRQRLPLCGKPSKHDRAEPFVARRAQRFAVEDHGITVTQGARWHARRDRASLIGFRTQNASFPAVPYGVALCNYEALRAKLPLQLPRPFPRRQRLPRRCHRLPRRRLNLQRRNVHVTHHRPGAPQYLQENIVFRTNRFPHLPIGIIRVAPATETN